jgi:hypothetical protein
MARSGSPVCAATRTRISIGAGPSTASFSNRDHSHHPLDQFKRNSFITERHVGEREITNKVKIFRLFFEEMFQFAARLSPRFLGGGMVAEWGRSARPIQICSVACGLAFGTPFYCDYRYERRS